ncbi:phosphatidylserine decarboxylase [Besnoitia besnoiti]|uniref:Phosphatidylserine decarboxylase proenzyme, mitochondrial n=1 Tax=Besnoitia besnoiti TaxID=94643 RepID=A0A2A9MB53_BESBE|nr:phosphatidylserine decarboxylase [Besnoitia besnoiti]PFH35205.1 phosphatidylserine decarboxylase [Besnoitia besnoiti]
MSTAVTGSSPFGLSVDSLLLRFVLILRQSLLAMSRRFVNKFDQAVTAALGPNGRYIAMVGMSASAVLLTFHYKFHEVIQATDNVAEIQSPSKLFYLRLLFGRTRSRITGSVMNIQIWPALRDPIYRALATVGGIDTEEIRYPLHSYKCIGHLFARTLKDREREIEDIGTQSLASPADGMVTALGDVQAERVEQVKGATYSLRAFLGLMPTVSDPEKNTLKFVVLHLKPKNYHHFHAPAKFDVNVLRHMTGETLPVFSSFLKRFNDIFSVNERVVMSGNWKYGCMHMVAVAAYNVGNIRIDKEPELRTNELRVVLRHLGGDVETRSYANQPFEYAVGQHVGEFRLGSTVVLVFEAPRDFAWDVKPGDPVRVGKRLGGVGPPQKARTEDERLFAFY